ncbi:prim-pol domain-containing protein [Cantharellus anzutake]|uniref:prim-pol domain-containing protein n=1 Tax=Cantharellus anzutake TaxID=1750568 RepID=UPI001904A1F5|nr:prim-pol domain-containing protein [Cantharellus anzutake]KAF8330760.1 prim-pol domain-containing protein [Cantharellus anzutake]
MSGTDSQVILAYYKRLFPFKSIYAWLNHQHPPTRLWTNREFAFTVNGANGEAYLRWLSFSNADELKKEVIRLNPSRFEVGAVYSARPRDKKTVQPKLFTPHLRELVFDIDMTDYDEIRTCCSGKGICKRCWGYIAAAVDVIDHVLREQFGYNHLLWVYSGRRGIHCWVSDQAAMSLTDDARRSLLEFVKLIQGGSGEAKRVRTRYKGNTGPMHPMLFEALGTLQEGFSDLCLEDQDCFKDRKGWEKLLDLLPHDDELTKDLRRIHASSVDKWGSLRSKASKIPKSSPRGLFTVAMEEIILQYTYPRIDEEVTKKRNHLLKAPFCVHPATGNICVPVDPQQVHSFDPEKVPKVDKLLRELDEMMQEDGAAEHHSDWERTSLKPYVQMMDKYTSGIMKEIRSGNRAAAARSLDF